MFRLREKQFAALAAILIGGLLCSKWSLAAAQKTLLWQTNLETAKQVAAQTNRLILVHFWSPTCAACKQLDKNVYTIPQVQQSIEARFVPVKINADDWPTTTKQYGITSLPTDLIITSSGQIVGRMVCPAAPDAYMQQLAVAASGAGPIAGLGGPSYGVTVPPGTATGVAAVATPPAGGWMPAPSAAPANPAMSATPPIAASAAAPNVGWGAVPPSNSNSSAPAVPAYTDSRYAEYFQRYSAASTGAAAGISAAPGAATAAPAAGSSASYTAPSYAPAAYTPPAYATVNSPAVTPNYAAPAANSTPPGYGSPATSPAPAAGAPTYAAPTYGSPGNTSSPYAPPTSSAAPTSPSTAAAMSAPIAAQRNSSPTAQSQLTAPAGTTVATTAAAPPLALDGYCPVTLAEQQRWQLGDRRWGAIHRGRTYLFSGPEQQRKFLANPDRYSPAISGQDVVMALDHGQEVEGKRAMGVEYQNRVYLFSSDASRQAFSQNPKRYATEVLQAETPSQTTLR